MRSRLLAICREGWIYLLILGFMLGAAVLRQINLLMLFWGLLAAPVVLSFRLLRIMLTDLHVRRVLPGPISAGDLLVVRVSATNKRRRVGTWSLTVEDTIEHVQAGRATPWRATTWLPYIPAGETRQAGYRGRLGARGKYRFGPLRASTRFPFGLLRRAWAMPQREELIVMPRLGRLNRGWRQLQEAAYTGAGRGHRRHGSIEGDFYGLREWRADDSRRYIHWRTSAKRQTLLVRQFEEERRQDFVVVLDLWQPERPTPAELDNVELAVSFAATIVADLCRRGGGELVLATSAIAPQRVAGPTSPALMREAMECLALTNAGPREGLSAALTGALAVARAGARVVVLSTRATDLVGLARSPALAGNSHLQAFLHRAVAIDTSSNELGHYFEIDVD